MASAPQPSLPILYNDLVPLSSEEHAAWKARSMGNLDLIRGVHALPLTTDEFIVCQRSHPIVFTSGDEPLPIALYGLNDGVNLFLDEAGMPTPEAYLPAYVRRYPFMLVRLRPDSEDLSLCFDPSADLLGDFEEGLPLFENGEPTDQIKGTLEFCEQFEMGAQRTGQFMTELKQMGLLMEGEVSIQQPGVEQPFIYRGFQMVDEQKLRDLRGDQLRKMIQSGMLPIIHAHLFSLSLLPLLFQRQINAGQVPGFTANPPADAPAAG
jgi:hypothetical protein